MFLLSFQSNYAIYELYVFLDFNLVFPICISEINEQLDSSRFMFLEVFFCCADFLS